MILKDVNDRIKNYLERYFPLNLGFDITDKIKFEVFRILYKEYLIKKYGRDVIREYDGLSRIVLRKNTDKPYNELNSFVFRTGLINDIMPEVQYRTERTLESLLTHLTNINHPFSVLDLGSGDGRMDIGLALCLDNLEKLYAVDINKFASYRMKENIRLLSLGEQEIVNKKIIPVRKDFTKNAFIEWFVNTERNGINVVLTAYARYHPLPFMELSAMLLKDKGAVIVCYPYNLVDGADDSKLKDSVDRIIKYGDEQGSKFGLKFELVDYFRYAPNKFSLIEIGVKI